jgi:hypothetical protein
MQMTYTPELCSGEGAEYEGSLTLRMPSYDERMGLYEEADFDMDGSGDATAQKKQTMRLMRLIARKLPDYLVKLSVKRKADGFEFQSFEELSHDTDMAPLITEACTKLVGKYQVGNGSRPT